MQVLEDVITHMVRQALAEDIGSGDITAALIPEQQNARARLICREDMILCGRPWAETVFAQVDERIRVHWHAEDGARLAADQALCQIEGPARAILTAERTAINFLQTLSGTATLTHRYVQRVSDTGVRILDTRKTLPGWRLAQKYAVACGGGHNHRIGLYDAYLIKENHISAAGSIAAAVDTARQNHADKPIEVEVEDLAQLQQALNAGVDRVLLDNFTPANLRKAVEINAGRAVLEASGGITYDNLHEIALTGVNDISIGALTKDIHAIDLSLRFSD